MDCTQNLGCTKDSVYFWCTGPITNNTELDKLVWKPSTSGACTSKEAYKQLALGNQRPLQQQEADPFLHRSWSSCRVYGEINSCSPGSRLSRGVFCAKHWQQGKEHTNIAQPSTNTVKGAAKLKLTPIFSSLALMPELSGSLAVRYGCPSSRRTGSPITIAGPPSTGNQPNSTKAHDHHTLAPLERQK